MRKNTLSKKFVAVMVAAVAMLSLMVLPAYASQDSQVSITGGTLYGGEITFGNFSPITLDGSDKTATATWAINGVTDARGTGAGWNVSLTLTQFKEWDDTYVELGKTLATSSVKVTNAPVVTLADPSSSAVGTITVVTAAAALDTTSPVNLLSSALAGGMGSFAVSPMTVTMTVPANVYARAYKTDATVALVTGP